MLRAARPAIKNRHRSVPVFDCARLNASKRQNLAQLERWPAHFARPKSGAVMGLRAARQRGAESAASPPWATVKLGNREAADVAWLNPVHDDHRQVTPVDVAACRSGSWSARVAVTSQRDAQPAKVRQAIDSISRSIRICRCFALPWQTTVCGFAPNLVLIWKWNEARHLNKQAGAS